MMCTVRLLRACETFDGHLRSCTGVLATCWTAYVGMGLVPAGWPCHCLHFSLVIIVCKVTYMIACAYKAVSITGFEPWAYLILVMEMSYSAW